MREMLSPPILLCCCGHARLPVKATTHDPGGAYCASKDDVVPVVNQSLRFHSLPAEVGFCL
jgi:hypothetical protein